MQISIDEIDRTNGEWLGSGAFGRVFEATYQNKKIAYKMLKHAFHSSMLYREIEVLEKLSGHDNIVKYLGYIRENNFLGIVMEKVDGISLLACIHHYDMPRQLCEKISIDIIDALVFIHSHNIIYRDLKPDNIIINMSSHCIKIVDFGNGIIIPDDISDVIGIVGTHGYMAPEVYKSLPYGLLADIYSLGMTLYHIWTMEQPSRHRYVIWALQKGYYGIPKKYISIMKMAIEEDPKNRPNAIKIKEYIKMKEKLNWFDCLF